MMKTQKVTAASSAPAALPTHIVLLVDWGAYLAGKVLIGDMDLIAALDHDGARYRAATPNEISIAGL